MAIAGLNYTARISLDKRTLIDHLVQAGSDNPSYEAKIILEDVAPDNMQAVIARRMTGEPLWRVLGYRDFWKHRFYMSPETLEPRPDTETLIEAVLNGQVNPPRRILDIGVGTGCILLSLLDEYPQAAGVGVDIQAGAIRTAYKNAERLGVSGRVAFLESDWLSAVTGRFDLIVSNPPYIPSATIANLESHVRDFDPLLALDGGNDGLDPYKILLPVIKNHLEPGGRVLFEIGVGQVDDLRRLAEANGATLIRVISDLNGIERVVEIAYGDN